MTSLGSLRVERPAVRAKGTVRPSERPMVASAIVRVFTSRVDVCVLRLGEGFSLKVWFDVVWLCDSPASVSFC